MTNPSVKTIAFYLPQFHPFPENDSWWGKGFTEWRNVVRARPMFEGHDQPRLPADLGFYDLRLGETRAEQAKLARQYGIHGFCYYYYWFSGRKLMQRPLEEVVGSGNPDFPFCICWANENWSRNWDGGNAEILVEQRHTLEADTDFIKDVLPILRDQRYICIDGKPLLIVYCISLMTDPAATALRWRAIAEEAGLPGLHLCAALSFDVGDPTAVGFDSAVEFPPHGYKVGEITNNFTVADPAFRGKIFDYAAVMSYSIGRDLPSFPLFRTAMLAWDNSARKRLTPLVFQNCTPALYEAWIAALAEQTVAAQPPEQRFIFVNAWNEWAEGSYLEPDMRWGTAFLEAHSRAVGLTDPGDLAARIALTRMVSYLPEDRREQARRLITAIAEHAARLETEVQTLRSDERWSRTHGERKKFSIAVPRTLSSISGGGNWTGELKFSVDFPTVRTVGGVLPATRMIGLRLAGWMFSPTVLGTMYEGERLVVLWREGGEECYLAAITDAVQRNDVATTFPTVDSKYTIKSGFDVSIDLRLLTPGRYTLGAAMHDGREGAFARTSLVIEVI
jgi:hypothetical protein